MNAKDRYVATAAEFPALAIHARTNRSMSWCVEVGKKSNGRCAYCWEPIDFTDQKSWELDHVIPVSRGGSSEASNIVVTCFRCNRVKRDLTYHEFVLLCHKIATNHKATVEQLLRTYMPEPG